MNICSGCTWKNPIQARGQQDPYATTHFPFSHSWLSYLHWQVWDLASLGLAVRSKAPIPCIAYHMVPFQHLRLWWTITTTTIIIMIIITTTTTISKYIFLCKWHTTWIQHATDEVMLFSNNNNTGRRRKRNVMCEPHEADAMVMVRTCELQSHSN